MQAAARRPTRGHATDTIACVPGYIAADPELHWLADPAVLAPLGLVVYIYVRRFIHARREAGGRGAGFAQAAAFTGAMLALLAALVSPLDGLGEDYLFSAHMLQHVLLGDVAPVLFLLSLSRVIMRPATRRLQGVEKALGPLASPWTGLAVWLGIMYFWHIPALYDDAVTHPVVHHARAVMKTNRPADAIAELAIAKAERYPEWHWIAVDPNLAPLRAHSEFIALVTA